MKFSFGKHKGQEIDGSIPLSYLSWLVCFCVNYPQTVEACKAEIKKRGLLLKDLYAERDKLIGLGLYSKTGTFNAERYKEIRREERRMASISLQMQMEDSGFLQHLDRTIGESNGGMGVVERDWIFGNPIEDYDDLEY